MGELGDLNVRSDLTGGVLNGSGGSSRLEREAREKVERRNLGRCGIKPPRIWKSGYRRGDAKEWGRGNREGRWGGSWGIQVRKG